MSVPSASIVTCVEYGSLETMAIRMIESLRRWGGEFANLPVYAVKPRFGIPLRKETLKAFDRLNVTFMDIRPETKYTWFRFLNKPLSVMAVADRVDSEEIFWI